MQEHILDKLQLLLDQRTIRGTYENGTEYTILATVLNLSKNMVRILQRFDFTKRNPKLVYIHTSDTLIPLEDSILAAFLNLIGFDIVFFIPTRLSVCGELLQQKGNGGVSDRELYV